MTISSMQQELVGQPKKILYQHRARPTKALENFFSDQWVQPITYHHKMDQIYSPQTLGLSSQIC